MSAQEKLLKCLNKNLHICVGLDSSKDKIPSYLLKFDNPIFEFNKIIIDATVEFAAAYKINFAFYEFYGIEGIEILKKTIDYIGENSLIIADAKRGDIGNTSQKYAQSIFDYFKCDAVTLNPYMGFESVQPFLEYSDKLSFVLGLTSNKSAEDFEKKKLINGKFLFQEVISKVNDWNVNKNCGIVFGATNLTELKENFNLFSNMPILLPGVGAQGGSLEEVVGAFVDFGKNDFLINISRGLIYINNSQNFYNSVQNKLIEINNKILSLVK